MSSGEVCLNLKQSHSRTARPGYSWTGSPQRPGISLSYHLEQCTLEDLVSTILEHAVPVSNQSPISMWCLPQSRWASTRFTDGQLFSPGVTQFCYVFLIRTNNSAPCGTMAVRRQAVSVLRWSLCLYLAVMTRYKSRTLPQGQHAISMTSLSKISHSFVLG